MCLSKSLDSRNYENLDEMLNIALLANFSMQFSNTACQKTFDSEKYGSFGTNSSMTGLKAP